MAPVVNGLVSIALRACLAGGSGLGILSSMNVQFVVTDPAGRRTGFDPVTGTVLSEIPSSRYDVKDTGVLEGGNEGRSRDFVAAFGSSDELIDGPYTFAVYGEKPGPFWLSISVYRAPVSDDLNIRGTIRRGELKRYRLIYSGDPAVPVRIDTVGSK
jgi:hypothetical protein